MNFFVSALTFIGHAKVHILSELLEQVNSYIPLCFQGHYNAFSLLERAFSTTTVGFCFNSRLGKLFVQ